MKKIIGITSSVILMIAIILIAVTPYLYQRAEKQSFMRSTAHCVMLNVGVHLNKNFIKGTPYPNNDEFLSTIDSILDHLGCGQAPEKTKGSLLDPFGDPYCYVKTSDNQATIYSRNVFFINYDKVTDQNLAFSLDSAMMNTQKLKGSESCSS